MGDWDARQRERAKRMRFLQYRGFDAEVSQALVFDGPSADEPLLG
jgi:SOS response regulatory protein OraA/RecX